MKELKQDGTRTWRRKSLRARTGIFTEDSVHHINKDVVLINREVLKEPGKESLSKTTTLLYSYCICVKGSSLQLEQI